MSPPGPPRLYAIADADALEAAPGPAGVERMVSAIEALAGAGVAWIQVRMKRATDRDRYAVVEESCRRLDRSADSLWIDDRADLAALFPVLGVHVGRCDLPPAAARQVLGTSPGSPKLVGWSCHGRAQVAEAERCAEVDVVACGPIFPTDGKADPDPVVGLDTLARCRAETAKPLVAIGGIRADRLAAVFAAGADTAVVLGAVCRAPDGSSASLREVASSARALVVASNRLEAASEGLEAASNSSNPEQMEIAQ